jgi:N-methylhydantoinase B
VETRYHVGGEDTQIVVFGDGDVEPAFGLFGGGPGSLNKIELHRPDGTVYKATSKDLVPGVPAGTLYIQEAGGGGGFGPPFERPVERVLAEVRDGLISVEAAAEQYGVVIDPKRMRLNEKETRHLREKLAKKSDS